MKSKSSAPHTCAESSGLESADLDETADLPALSLTGDLKDCNDEDVGPSPRDRDSQSARLIELGEAINKKLERIATALEKLPSDPSRHTQKRKRAAKPVTRRKKKATKATSSS